MTNFSQSSLGIDSQKTHTQRLQFLLTITALLLLFGCSDIVTEHYQSYEEAVKAGAETRGWLPSFVPPTAKAIDLVHDLDTNHQWFHFNDNLESLQSITQNMKMISLSELKKNRIIKPKGIKNWPTELDELMFATPRASLRFFNTCSSSGCLCIAIDSSNGNVFGWSCQQAI